MRWYLESNETPPRFIDFQFGTTEVQVWGGFVGEAGEEQERLEFSDPLVARDVLTARARALFADGWELRLPPEDRWVAEPQALNWWKTQLREALGVETAEEAAADRMESFYGGRFAPELREFVALRASADPQTQIGTWLPAAGGDISPDPANGNLFEQLVVADQRDPYGTHLLQYFADMVPFGGSPSGDKFFAHPNPLDPLQAEIVWWDHESRRVEVVVADAPSTFAWAQASIGEHDFTEAGLELVRARISFPPRLRDGLDETVGNYEPKSRAMYYFWRCYWMTQLLRPHPNVAIEQIGELFFVDYHAPLLFSDALSSRFIRESTITALYWLWRLWWFDSRDDLATCIEVTREHRSPLVRDAAALIEELQGGRRDLGAIADIHEMRNNFLALGLDPASAEERAAKATRALQEEEAALARNLELGHDLVARHDVEALRVMLADYEDNPTVLQVLHEHLEHHDRGVD